MAHESIFNVNDGAYRCPNSQQGYSPFTTWTRGLAWIMCGYAELLEYVLSVIPERENVTAEADEPPFHAPWEGRVVAIMRAMAAVVE